MVNGHLRTRAVEIIEGGLATVDEKLDLLLQITLDNIDSIEAVRKDVNANPLAWVPETWRKRVAIVFAGWAGWVTLNLSGVPIGIPAILDWLNKLK